MNSSSTQTHAYESDRRHQWSLRQTAYLLGMSYEELLWRIHLSPRPVLVKPSWWSRLQHWFRGE